jgi:3-oxoacyl-[acyl-carrier protein] reductase
MDLGIAGKWALVCGASKGLGLGCAQALAEAGVNLLIVARGADALAQAAQTLREQHGVQVLAVAADITTADGRAQVFAARADFDIVVTNAGGPPPGDFRQWERGDWLAAIDANMLAPIGRIVNITSGAVKAPIDVLGLSNGARSGLTGFVAGVSRQRQLAANHVTINNLLPGWFDTDRIRSIFSGAAEKTGTTVEYQYAARMKSIPAGRIGSAQEFGQTCAFLCSQHAGYITGQNILIDGGAYPGTF